MENTVFSILIWKIGFLLSFHNNDFNNYTEHIWWIKVLETMLWVSVKIKSCCATLENNVFLNIFVIKNIFDWFPSTCNSSMLYLERHIVPVPVLYPRCKQRKKRNYRPCLNKTWQLPLIVWYQSKIQYTGKQVRFRKVLILS